MPKKKVAWASVYQERYLKEENKALYNTLINKAYRNGNIPGVDTIMLLDDTDLYSRWNIVGKDYRTATLHYEVRNILRIVGVTGRNLIDLCKSAYSSKHY